MSLRKLISVQSLNLSLFFHWPSLLAANQHLNSPRNCHVLLVLSFLMPWLTKKRTYLYFASTKPIHPIATWTSNPYGPSVGSCHRYVNRIEKRIDFTVSIRAQMPNKQNGNKNNKIPKYLPSNLVVASVLVLQNKHSCSFCRFAIERRDAIYRAHCHFYQPYFWCTFMKLI